MSAAKHLPWTDLLLELDYFLFTPQKHTALEVTMIKADLSIITSCNSSSTFLDRCVATNGSVDGILLLCFDFEDVEARQICGTKGTLRGWTTAMPSKGKAGISSVFAITLS